jgi:hypothetical protein
MLPGEKKTMPTVEEVLRESGFTDVQIKALDPKAITAFGGVLSTAERERHEATKAREAAELAQRSNVDFYENKIAPSLANWEEEKQKIENERARAAAEAAFYRTQAEEAKKGGFIATDAPGFDATKFANANPNQPRDGQGRYVAGAGPTPGSPGFDVNTVYQRAGDAVGLIADIQWEHERLFGSKMPISPTELIRQADSVKLDPRTYAARTFNWDTRRQQMSEEEAKKHDDVIRAEANAPLEQKLKEQEAEFKKKLDERDRQWAERIGSNPDIRRPVDSKFADVTRGVKDGTIPDPLMMTDQQRRALTSSMIRKDIAELTTQ